MLKIMSDSFLNRHIIFKYVSQIIALVQPMHECYSQIRTGGAAVFGIQFTIFFYR